MIGMIYYVNVTMRSAIFIGVGIKCADLVPTDIAAQCVQLLQILWDTFVVLHKYRDLHQGLTIHPYSQICSDMVIFKTYSP